MTSPGSPDSPAALRAEAEGHLRALAGPGAVLREDQWLAIEALAVQRRRALVVQRTGWGKSAVYLVATALLRARGAGATVIVSPLLALMRNQVAAAERAGIRAATVNSANLDEWEAVHAAVRAGEIDVLLVSPERLNNPAFRDEVLPSLAAGCGLLVVDEAHCISDWGHDFRPDYRRIAALLEQLPAGTPVLATTATANSRVVTDVADQLALHGRPEAEVLVQRGTLERESLHLSVLSLPSDAHRLAWLVEHLPALPGSGIVYSLTVAGAEEVAAHLSAAGLAVLPYTGRTDPAARAAAEEALLADEVKALVATSALGMGFDKPDLGFVVHLGAPSSPIAYYQQVGRAGRGIERAEAVLLPGEADEAIWRYFASLGFPAEADVRAALSALADAGRPLSTAALEPVVDLRRTRLEMMLSVLDVEGAVRKVKGGWVSTGEPWVYDAERHRRVAEQRAAEQAAMRTYVSTTGCRMELLRRELDDPGAAPCGRCDTCTGTALAAQVGDAALTAARTELARPGVAVDPRAMWPSGLAAHGLSLAGKIPAGLRAEPGRALARLSDPGWGTRLRTLLAPGSPDAAPPADVLAAVVEVLAGWGWSTRPAAVVALPSTHRPALVAGLARHVATVGRLPLLTSPQRARPPAERRGFNAARRLMAVHGALTVPPPLLQELVDLQGAPVLLVDDVSDTGWTLTDTARLLREAGAGPVLPLVLALEG